MLGREDNELLCEVEPGKPMHDVFKRYWMPVATSKEAGGPDSDPMRLTLLGEDYVLFRDSLGQPALMRELCCHRGASLMLGRVEDGGIRCIYHGWKFAADGTILDMPNCDDERFKTRYRQPAFPVVEKAGLIWTYLGPAEKQPPFPHYPFMDVPDSHRITVVPVVSSNYLQTMEGLLDSSHLGVLHKDGIGNPARRASADTVAAITEQKAPRFEAEDCAGGSRYVAIRKVPGADGETRELARVTAFNFPSLVFIAPSGIAVFSVPSTSRITYFVEVIWSDTPYTDEEREARLASGGVTEPGMKWGLGREYHGKPGTASRENNWLQDREKMRRGESFSGLINFLPEDAAVVGSSGAIYDRTHENLLPADLGIARVRRVLMENLKAVQAGEDARGTDLGDLVLPAVGFIGPDIRWQDLTYGPGPDKALADA